MGRNWFRGEKKREKRPKINRHNKSYADCNVVYRILWQILGGVLLQNAFFMNVNVALKYGIFIFGFGEPLLECMPDPLVEHMIYRAL